MTTREPRHGDQSRASLPRCVRDFRKAYSKARQWRCTPLAAVVAACRYAATGDSGRFLSHDGARLSRIFRGDS